MSEYRDFDVGDVERSLIGDGAHLVRYRGELTRACYATAKIVSRVAEQFAEKGNKSQAARLRYIRSCLESGNTPSKKSIRAAAVDLRDVYAIAEQEPDE
jgi:hypothetical protein